MLTKTVIGKKSDAHDSKESPRFASRLKKNYLLYENLSYIVKTWVPFTKNALFGWKAEKRPLHLCHLSREGSLSCQTCYKMRLQFTVLFEGLPPFSRLLQQARVTEDLF